MFTVGEKCLVLRVPFHGVVDALSVVEVLLGPTGAVSKMTGVRIMGAASPGRHAQGGIFHDHGTNERFEKYPLVTVLLIKVFQFAHKSCTHAVDVVHVFVDGRVEQFLVCRGVQMPSSLLVPCVRQCPLEGVEMVPVALLLQHVVWQMRGALDALEKTPRCWSNGRLPP